MSVQSCLYFEFFIYHFRSKKYNTDISQETTYCEIKY